MYSNKQNVLQLVALMRSHGVKRCVLCPGSRDIPIVQSILQCPDFETYSITDERSAGFFAIGLSLETDCSEAVAVVVTSGSALLGLHAAVSEAFYQKVPLLVISADRPAAWIGQMDGQTLPQENVFNTLVKKSVGLVEVQSEEDRWFNNRMINEALLELDHRGRGPVHINVPISDPFFEFTTPELPDERVITRFTSENFRQIEHFKLGPDALYQEVEYDEYEDSSEECIKLAKALTQCKSVMLIVGQSPDFMEHGNDSQVYADWKDVSEYVAVLSESISNAPNNYLACTRPDMLVTQILTKDGKYRQFWDKDKEYPTCPELVITIGGHIISKNLKKFLRASKPKYHFHVSADGEVVDLFKCLSTVIEMDEYRFIDLLDDAVALLSLHQYLDDEDEMILDEDGKDQFLNLGLDLGNLKSMMQYANAFVSGNDSIVDPRFEYSHMQAMQLLRENLPEHSVLHLANSSTVRYDQLFFATSEEECDQSDITVMANRGVNGIEGSLSTAIGYAAASKKINFIVIGDLSFFYDMNALWNDYVGNNVRIILLNNGGGEIFHALPGLNLSDKEKKYVTAQHQTDAQAWAESRGFVYRLVTDERTLRSAISTICTEKELDAPQFVEVVTEAQSDAAMLKQVLRDCMTKAQQAQKPYKPVYCY